MSSGEQRDLVRDEQIVFVDAHAHLPMFLRPRGGDTFRDALRSREGRFRLLERINNWFLSFGERLWNRQSFFSGPRVTVPLLREGGVDIALSVLYMPFYEGDLIGLVEPRYGRPSSDECFVGLMRQLRAVEEHVATRYPGDAACPRNWPELQETLAQGKLALLHCVEGGFHLGSSEEVVDRNVRVLAEHGVAYITLAHLFWRGFATNEPVLPLLRALDYQRLFPQPDVGLSELGRAAVCAMVREKVLIDLTHMSSVALDDTFSVLDEVDPERAVPVLASHVAYRFGNRAYNLEESTVRRIAERDGVIGLIVGKRLMSDGLTSVPRYGADGVDVLCRHIDRLAEITGSYGQIAIGSDLGGFIKPLPGLEDAASLSRLPRALQARYGCVDARRILGGNMLRLLQSAWGGAARVAPGTLATTEAR